MYTLGIKAAFHDPALAWSGMDMSSPLLRRSVFTHVKHGKRPVPFSTYELPYHSIDYCLSEAALIYGC